MSRNVTDTPIGTLNAGDYLLASRSLDGRIERIDQQEVVDAAETIAESTATTVTNTLTAGLTTANDDLRRLLHDAGVMQAPLSVDPDTRVFWQGKGALYDSEQGGFPLDLPADSTSKALAVACTQSARSLWFGERADGTAAMWVDGRANGARVACAAPALTSSTVFVLEGEVYPQLPPSATVLLSEWPSRYVGLDTNAGGTDAAFRFFDGTTVHFPVGSVATALGFAPNAGDWEWRAVVNGASVDLDVRPAGGSWSTVATVVIALSALSGTVEVGTDFPTWGYRGQYNRFRVRDGGVSDSIVAEFTPGLFVAGNRGNGATATDAYGVTWTLTRPTAAATDEPKVIEAGVRRFMLPGATGEALQGDSIALSGPEVIDVRFKVTSDDLTPAGYYTIASQWGSDAAWLLRLANTGALQMTGSWDGSGVTSVNSAALPWGNPGDVLVGRVVADAVNRTGVFYTSSDEGQTWDLLSSHVFGDANLAAGWNNSTDDVRCGSFLTSDSQAWGGDIYWCEVYVDDVLVERFDPADADPDASTFVSSTSGATVTINRTTAANYHVEVIEANQAAIQTDGVNDYAVVIGDDSVPDFVSGTGLTIAADVRLHDGPAWYGVMSVDSASEIGPSLRRLASNSRLYGYFNDPALTAQLGEGADNITFGERLVAVMAFENADSEGYIDGSSIDTDGTAISTYSPGAPWSIGQRAGGGHGPGTFFAVGVVADRVADADAATISQELRL